MPWKPGQSGNPRGGKKSDARKLLEKAIEKAGEKRGKNFWDHLVERAYENDAVLVALARKFAPDLKSLDADINLRDTFRLVLSNGHSPAPDSKPEERDNSDDRHPD